MTAADHPVVLYDGVCGLCNRLVRMILRRDRGAVFRFAPLQGEFARAARARHRLSRPAGAANEMETMYVVVAPGSSEERLLDRSEAATYIWSRVRGPLRALAWMRFLPRFLRDALYDLVARRRYRWFGKHESCPLPPPEWSGRFLD
jgi:predicted DCC family thiol-disulfide oxidoreductase YuxK